MINHQPYPYIGTEKFLVIGIDVGTTHSGVSYALLEPGKVPRIQPVTRFSGQREENGKSKVCSVVYYDQDGNVIAAGPETDPEVNPMLSEIDVRRAECFKLHLWPTPPEPAEGEGENDVPVGIEQVGGGKLNGSKESRGGSEEEDLGGAPSREIVERQHPNKRKILRPVTDDFKTPVRVLTDFLQYLLKSAKKYITETERNMDPTFTWSSIEKNFVLTHPNEWKKKQQSQMRDAAVAAGLVNRATAADRITFVTEGEASFHFCLDKNPELRQERSGLLVVDCGGGTIELSAYSQTGKGRYKQIASPYCLRQGSISVTSRARDYFKGKFKDSQFGSDGDIETMARAFDKPEGVKCIFRYPNRPYFVNFGGLRDNDRKYGVSGGKFKVEGPQMAKFFDPAIQDIISGIENQCRNTRDGISIKYALLFGGFGRSQYLYQKLCDYCDSNGIVILRPDIAHLNKAVADGAVSWYLDRYVSSHSYDVMTRHLLDPTDPDHLNRESAAWTTVNTAGNRSQTVCVKQAFTLRRTKPSPKQVHAGNNGQKLPGTTGAANQRHEKAATVGSSSQARRNWQERRDTGEIGTGFQGSDCRSRKGHIERLKAEEARLNHYRGHSSEENTRTGDMKPGDGHRTTRERYRRTSMKGEQLHKLSPFEGKSDMISVADVAELVRTLNAQIEQASSFISDSLSCRESPISSKELEDVLDEFTSYIGSSLCNDLRSKWNIGPDALRTQVALRSALAKAYIYINTYTPTPQSGSWENNRKYLAGIAFELIAAVWGSLEGGGALTP